MITGMHAIDNFVPWAQKIEEYGFDELFIADDLIFRPAWPILTLIGANTKKIRVGPAIVNPITAHPVYHVANLLALDELTSGRAVCSMGKGAFNANLKLEHVEKPVRMVKEAYDIMKHVMAGNTDAFEGDYFSTINGFKFEFEPLRNDIPITIGTWGHQMARMAGRHTAGVLAACCSGPMAMKRIVDEAKAGAMAAGRDPETLELGSAPLSSISMDSEAARRNITDLLGFLMPTMEVLTRQLDITDEEVQTIFKHAQAGELDTVAKLIPERAVRAFSVAGSPNDVIPQLEEMIDLGVNHINFSPPLGPDVDVALELIAKEILPYFKNRN